MKKQLKNPKKADLNKDGQLSGYEKKRGMAIEESMGVKMGSLILASNGELVPYREFKKRKLEQDFEKSKEKFFKDAEKEVSNIKGTKNEKYERASTIQKDKKALKGPKGRDILKNVDPKTYADEFKPKKPSKPSLTLRAARAFPKVGIPGAIVGLGLLGYEAYQGYKAGKKYLEEKKNKKSIGGLAVKGFKKKTPIY